MRRCPQAVRPSTRDPSHEPGRTFLHRHSRVRVGGECLAVLVPRPSDPRSNGAGPSRLGRLLLDGCPLGASRSRVIDAHRSCPIRGCPLPRTFRGGPWKRGGPGMDARDARALLLTCACLQDAPNSHPLFDRDGLLRRRRRWTATSSLRRWPHPDTDLVIDRISPFSAGRSLLLSGTSPRTRSIRCLY